jgi:hypothetical protein
MYTFEPTYGSNQELLEDRKKINRGELGFERALVRIARNSSAFTFGSPSPPLRSPKSGGKSGVEWVDRG